MGVVYLAEHPVIGRKVAMKAIHPELSRNPEVVSRFITEAKSVNQIGNEHIVEIYDFGNTGDGEFYFIMEFLQGEALADRLKRDRLFPGARALQVAAQVADALAASHTHGIIHRDLKPENIFLINRGSTQDFVKVLDFGLAKLTQGEEKVTHKTRTGSVMGTPYYMAPEQCEGKANIDHRADLYSLGVILFEMMTGKVPFGGEGYGEIIVKHITQKPPAPRSLNPAITPAQDAILMRALAKQREDRFQNMEDFRKAMLDPDAYLRGAPRLPTTPPPVNVSTLAAAAADAGGDHPESAPSTFRHGAGELLDDDVPVATSSRKPLVIAIVAAAVLAGGGAFLYVKNQSDAPPAAATTTPTPPVAPTAPAEPKTVAVSFESNPSGAAVVMKDTGQEIGTTPFQKDFPYGKKPLEFVFRKTKYDDASASFIPDVARVVSGTLPPQRAAAPAPEAAPPASKASKTSSHHSRPATAPAATKPPKKTGRPVNDEDGVLEPSFK
jgi:serine/threonine-protein kinase